MIRIFVAVTDGEWFRRLSVLSPEEVNFWQPSGRQQFQALQPGEFFLFKLHAPDNYIAGGGIFSHASIVPLSTAWLAFGEKNGVASIDEMRRRIARYTEDQSVLDVRTDPPVGCRILTQPFFWPREKWMPVPASWARQIVTGKGYSTDDQEGLALWNGVMKRLAANPSFVLPSLARFGQPQLITPRLGQGAFRLAVTDAYERRCAVTGERTLPILDAAHIRSYAAGGEHSPSNGLLLRTDIHRLFDLGYVTVDTDHRFVVSGRLKADFDNGREYYALHGVELRDPLSSAAYPERTGLEWHRDHRFLG